MDPAQTPQPLDIPPEVRTFLETILEDAKMTTLDDAMHEKMVQELFTRLDGYLMETVVESLPPEKLEEFTQMAEKGTPRPELESYLQQNIPNAQEVFAQAMLEFRDIYLGNVDTARNTQNPLADQPLQPEYPPDNNQNSNQ